MDRGWESFEVHATKSQDCHEGIVKGESVENSEKKEERCRESILYWHSNYGVTGLIS